jgi:hypothetical protein
MNRQKLYDRIDYRVDLMMKNVLEFRMHLWYAIYERYRI